MPANTNPIFVLTPQAVWGTLTTANTAKDGTGTVLTVFTAGASGSRIEKLVFAPLGTNVQTVARVFINNGQASGVAANNTLIREITIPASTLSETTEQIITELVFTDDLKLPAGYKLNVVIGTAVAAGIQCTAVGADF